MNLKDKEVAEKVIRYLCLNSDINGYRFHPCSQLLLSGPDDGRNDIDGQIFINLESRFKVYSSMPSCLPQCEEDIEELNEEEELNLIFKLKRKRIIDIKLGDLHPHLIITFESGEVLFVNGNHYMYESWQLGVAYQRNNDLWLVVACPGSEIAVWAPKSFGYGYDQTK